MKKILKWLLIITMIIGLTIFITLGLWIFDAYINDGNNFFDRYESFDIVGESKISDIQRKSPKTLYQSFKSEKNLHLAFQMLDVLSRSNSRKAKLYYDQTKKDFSDMNNSFSLFDSDYKGFSIYCSMKDDDIHTNFALHKDIDIYTMSKYRYERIDRFIPDGFITYLSLKNMEHNYQQIDNSTSLKNLFKDVIHSSNYSQINKLKFMFSSINRYWKKIFFEDFRLSSLFEDNLNLTVYNIKNSDSNKYRQAILLSASHSPKIKLINRFLPIVNLFSDQISIQSKAINDMEYDIISLTNNGARFYMFNYENTLFLSNNEMLIKKVVILAQNPKNSSAASNMYLTLAKSYVEKDTALFIHMNIKNKLGKTKSNRNEKLFQLYKKIDEKLNNESEIKLSTMKKATSFIPKSNTLSLTFSNQPLKDIIRFLIEHNYSNKRIKRFRRLLYILNNSDIYNLLQDGEFILFNGINVIRKETGYSYAVGLNIDRAKQVIALLKKIFPTFYKSRKLYRKDILGYDVYYIRRKSKFKPCFTVIDSYLIFASDMDIMKDIIKTKSGKSNLTIENYGIPAELIGKTNALLKINSTNSLDNILELILTIYSKNVKINPGNWDNLLSTILSHIDKIDGYTVYNNYNPIFYTSMKLK